jgi:hypothetical protein
VGATTNKNRDRLQIKFAQIKEELQKELNAPAASQSNPKNQEKTLSRA